MDEFSFVPFARITLEPSPDVPPKPKPHYKPLILEDDSSSVKKLTKLFKSLPLEQIDPNPTKKPIPRADRQGCTGNHQR